MKRIVAVLFASAAVVVPASAAMASGPAQPLGFECLIADGVDAPEAANAVTNCGANRNQ